MRKHFIGILLLFTCTIFLAGFAYADKHGNSMPCEKVYTCACGAGCACNTVSMEPGKCSCGKEMMERQVLKDDADNNYVCGCGAKCNCTGVSTDGNKCSCGKDLKAYPKANKPGCACCQKRTSAS